MINKVFITAVFIVSLLPPGRYSIYFFSFAILFLLAKDFTLFNSILNRQFLFFVFILIILFPLLTGKKDFVLFGIQISTGSFYNGLLMLLRSVIITLCISYLSKTSDKQKLQKIFNKMGITGFDEILLCSLRLFPLIKEKVKEFSISNKKEIYFNPVECTARFLALLFRYTIDSQNKINNESIYEE